MCIYSMLIAVYIPRTMQTNASEESTALAYLLARFTRSQALARFLLRKKLVRDPIQSQSQSQNKKKKLA